MENKKTKIAIVILTILIIGLIAITYLYSDFNRKQMALLTEEANKILESNLIEDNINLKTKTERNYAVVEDAIKEYISSMKNIYVEMNELVSGINPDSIFSANNLPNKELNEIENIINQYKEKSQNCISEIESLITEEKIAENINQREITMRKEYYTELYNTIMNSDAMKAQFNKLEEEIKNKKGTLYEKLNKIEKIRKFLEENEDSWYINDDGKIEFSSSNKFTQYHNMLNQLID